MTEYLVLDVGGSGIKHAVADEHYRLSDKGSVANTFGSHAEFVEAVGRLYDAVAHRVSGIAVSTAGELDPVTGHMLSGGYLRFNAGTNMIESVSRRCPTRVTVENDANCALLAEHHDGALTGCRTAAVFVLGTAVGGALLIDGHIHHGTHFHAGNASFTLVDLDRADPRNPLAFRGGARGLVLPLAERLGVPADEIDGRFFFERLDAGDPAAAEILDAWSARLAAFLYNVQLILDVEVIAIGGGISAQPSVIASVENHLQRLFDDSIVPLPRPAVRACRHFNDANLLGALHHHLVTAPLTGRAANGATPTG